MENNTPLTVAEQSEMLMLCEFYWFNGTGYNRPEGKRARAFMRAANNETHRIHGGMYTKEQRKALREARDRDQYDALTNL